MKESRGYQMHVGKSPGAGGVSPQWLSTPGPKAEKPSHLVPGMSHLHGVCHCFCFPSAAE